MVKKELISELLSCADVMVVPSLEDNLPNIGIEAIACGVPVIELVSTFVDFLIK